MIRETILGLSVYCLKKTELVISDPISYYCHPNGLFPHKIYVPTRQEVSLNKVMVLFFIFILFVASIYHFHTH